MVKVLTQKLNWQDSFKDWNYGAMHPLGFRQLPGGCPRDGYAPYPGCDVLKPEDVSTLFSYVKVGLSWSMCNAYGQVLMANYLIPL